MSDYPAEILQQALPGVQRLQPYQPGKPVSELERELGLSDIIKLASNENPLGASPAALSAARAALDALHRYPDGNGFALRQALAQQHDRDIDWITLGNGSNDALELIARVFLGPGRNAVFSEHAFAVYPIVTCACGAQARVATAIPAGQDQAYGHDLQAMAAQVNEDTAVVFIANPNNPTGTWLASGPLKSFIGDLDPRIIVVVDEAYFEYVDQPDYPDTSLWLDEFPNLIVTRTFSKAHGLAALRIGCALARPPLTDLLNRVRQPFNCNAIAQAAALASLKDTVHIQNSVRSNKAGLAQLGQSLSDRGLDFIPSVGNFISFHPGVAQGTGRGFDGQTVYEALLREGVIVRPVGNYGLPDYLRVTVSTQAENNRFITALDHVLDKARAVK